MIGNELSVKWNEIFWLENDKINFGIQMNVKTNEFVSHSNRGRCKKKKNAKKMTYR